MATSGVTNSPFPFDEMLEQAAVDAGGHPVTPEEIRSCRRAIDLELINLQNSHPLLFSLETVQVTLTASQVTVSAASGTVGVLWAVLRVNDRDIPLTQMSYEEYLNLPHKDQEGRPTQFMLDRQRDFQAFWLWPVPNGLQTYVLKYARHKQLNDTLNMSDDVDVPRRFWPYIVLVMTEKLLSIRSKVKGSESLAALMDKVIRDKQQALSAALSEDRERASWFFVPKLPRIV